MNSVIDTNLFIYATYSRFPQFSQAKNFLKSCAEGSDHWYLSWGIIYEYLRVVTHTGIFSGEVLSFPKARENVLKFISFPNIEILQETEEHTQQLKALDHEKHPLAGNILHDAHTVILMREHGITKIYTADTDFNRFQGIKVVNPLR